MTTKKTKKGAIKTVAKNSKQPTAQDIRVAQCWWEYGLFTDTTATYPHKGKGTLAALIYPALGLNEEVGEVLAKVFQENAPREKVLAEVGDVLWYLVRLHSELDYLFLGPEVAASADISMERALANLSNRSAV